MQKRTIIIIAVIGVIVVFGLTLLVGSLRRPSTKQRIETGKVSTIRVIDVVNEPLVFDGIDIEVETRITRWINKNTFVVSEGGGTFNTSKNLIVVAKENFPLPKDAEGKEVGLSEKIPVHITGKARIVDKKTLEELTGINLESEVDEIQATRLDDWDTGIILIADRVERI